MPNRVTRARKLLTAALAWATSHSKAAKAARITKALDDLTPPPKPPQHRVFIPGAVRKPIPQTSTDPDIIPVGAVFHVAVSEASSLHDFFSSDGGVESTGYIRRDGTIEQYRPLTVECDAQFDGNSWIGSDGKRYGLTSWETQGMGLGEWTPEQVASIKQIIAFHRDDWAVPSRVCPTPNSPGFGYHALFDAWNHNHHSCPGPDRIAQFKRVIVPWLAKGGAA